MITRRKHRRAMEREVRPDPEDRLDRLLDWFERMAPYLIVVMLLGAALFWIAVAIVVTHFLAKVW